MNQVLQHRNVRTISALLPLDLKTELFERIMGDEHKADWRGLLRRFDECAKRLYNRLRE